MFLTFVTTVLLPFFVAWLLGRLSRGFDSPRWENLVICVATAAAFATGYAHLFSPDSAPWIPERNWHWLYPTAIAAGIGGWIASFSLVIIRIPIYVTLSLGVAMHLVPTWDNLIYGRTNWIAFLTVYFSAIATVVDLCGRQREGKLPGALALIASALALAALAGYSVNLPFAKMATICCVGLAGAAWGAHPSRFSPHLFAPIFATLVGGLAFASTVEPMEPLLPMLLIPLAAPAGMLASSIPGLPRNALVIGVIQLACLAAIVAVAVFIVLQQVHGGGSEW